jgi:adenosine deaminase
MTLREDVPNVDTHRHMGGSIPHAFLLHAMDVGACPRLTDEQLVRATTCHPDEEPDFYTFLSKFRYLDKTDWTEELIAKKIEFVCHDIELENLDAVFMDFSVSKYRHIGWSLKEAISFILDRFGEYSRTAIIPILSIKYESPEEAQLKIARIVDSNISDRICGIDFVGDEEKFNPKIQGLICDMWSDKFVRLHVGESQSEDHIRIAVDDFGISNIAHGIKISNRDLISRCVDRDISFDIAPTSNYLTGVVGINSRHPAKFMSDNNLTITVGSDDPNILNTNLHQEYELLEANGLMSAELSNIRRNSADMFSKWKKYQIIDKS